MFIEGVFSALKLRKLLSTEEFFDDTEFEGNFSDFSSDSEWEDEDEIVCEPYYIYLHIFHQYYIPFIITVGLTGNVLSSVVFLTTHLKMRSSSYYLAALAIVDFGFLSMLLIVRFSFANIFEIFHSNGWCQLFVYISSVCATLSVWLIVAFTVERFIAVQYPLQRPHICTVSRAKIVVLILFAVAFLSHIYVFWIAGIIKNSDGGEECEMLPDYQYLMQIINFVDTFTTLIIPVIMIVSMNTMIARNLLLFRKRLQRGSLDECLYNSKDSTEMQRTNIQSGNSRKISSHHSGQSSKTSSTSRRQQKNDQMQTSQSSSIHIKVSTKSVISTKNQQNITKTLLLISSVFIMLNLPSYVIRLLVSFLYAMRQKTPPEVLWCVQQFAMLLYYTNFSINFLLYAMCGVTFRRCLWQLLRNAWRKITYIKC